MSKLGLAASSAAIELDNIRLGRKFKVFSINELAGLLASGVPDRDISESVWHLITPIVIIMDRIAKSRNSASRIEDAIDDLESIIKQLRRVAAGPESIREAERDMVDCLILICLDISRYSAVRRRFRGVII